MHTYNSFACLTMCHVSFFADVTMAEAGPSSALGLLHRAGLQVHAAGGGGTHTTAQHGCHPSPIALPDSCFGPASAVKAGPLSVSRSAGPAGAADVSMLPLEECDADQLAALEAALLASTAHPSAGTAHAPERQLASTSRPSSLPARRPDAASEVGEIETCSVRTASIGLLSTASIRPPTQMQALTDPSLLKPFGCSA